MCASTRVLSYWTLGVQLTNWSIEILNKSADVIHSFKQYKFFYAETMNFDTNEMNDSGQSEINLYNLRAKWANQIFFFQTDQRDYLFIAGNLILFQLSGIY